MNQDRLQDELRALGDTLPGARRDLAAAVSARLAGDRGAVASPGRSSRRTRGGAGGAARATRRGLVLTPALLVAAAVAAVGLRLGVPGIDLTVGGDRAPLVDDLAPLVDDTAFLGDPAELTAARDLLGVTVLPDDPRFGDPEVRVATGGAAPRVTLLFAAGDGLPAVAGTGVGAMLTAFRADLLDVAIDKSSLPAGAVGAVDVAGAPGWWIEGEHVVRFRAADSGAADEPSRLAVNALVWHRDGVTFRLESRLSRDEAVAVAGSIGPG